MAAKMRQPPKGHVWIHIDRLDRKDGKVWAVQFWMANTPQYDCVNSVIIFPASYTQFFGPKGRQPKAVVAVPGGKVSVRGTTAYIT